MGLINLKTNLKSLKYGNDRPGGGSSNQPYIVTPIPDGLTYNGPDFLLRQGALQASLTDSERLFKFFSDPKSVRGLLFTTKQIALERQNPKMVNTNRIYLPTNTISQVGLNATGFHLNKQGLDPFELGYAQGGRRGYYYATKDQTLSGNNVENRLTIAYTAKIANQSLGALAINPFGITNLDPNALLSYSGGPDAPLGLGTTRIKLAGDGSGSPRDRTNTYNLVSQPSIDGVYTFDNSLFSQQESKSQKKSTSLIGLTDYRQIINDNLPSEILPSTEYSKFNREDTYKTSKTVYRLLDPTSLRNPNQSVSLDEVNASYIRSQQKAVDERLFDSDLIKFFFEVIDPEATNTPSDFLFFRAYLNSIGDGFKAEWTPYKYVGRAENFYRYGGFSRDVQLSFTIYAHSRAEMLPLYEKLNALVGTTSPRYSNKGYMLGNFIKLTVGTYFSNVPGIINNITLKPSFEAGWDINRTVGGSVIKTTDKTNYIGQIPRMIEIDMTFTPIHDFTPRYGETFINNEPAPLPSPTNTPSTTAEPIDTPSVSLNTSGLRSNLSTFTPNDRNPIGVDLVNPINNFG
jgi:hypothetical protein